jgi:hypothetical protein
VVPAQQRGLTSGVAARAGDIGAMLSGLKKALGQVGGCKAASSISCAPKHCTHSADVDSCMCASCELAANVAPHLTRCTAPPRPQAGSAASPAAGAVLSFSDTAPSWEQLEEIVRAQEREHGVNFLAPDLDNVGARLLYAWAGPLGCHLAAAAPTARLSRLPHGAANQ